jgi:hypothetical protein
MSKKKKYIVEAGDDIQLITLTGVKDGSAITMTGVIDTLETAEELEEEAYKRGHDTGYKKCLSKHDFDTPCANCDNYERGLNDAWLFASHLVRIADDVTDSIFVSDLGSKGLQVAFNMEYSEARKTYDLYFEKKEGEIRVGDEVKQVTNSGKPTGLVCIVTYISGDSMNGIQHNGRMVLCSSQEDRWWKKTGRHFDIKAILEDMQE